MGFLKTDNVGFGKQTFEETTLSRALGVVSDSPPLDVVGLEYRELRGGVNMEEKVSSCVLSRSDSVADCGLDEGSERAWRGREPHVGEC